MPARKGAGRKPYKPTDEQRELVKSLAAVGITQEAIGRVVGCNDDTLRKYYRDELDCAAIEANASVGGALFGKAMAGDTTAAIWWTKARMGWSEKKVHEHQGKDGAPLVLWGADGKED